jgi:hypothetical protein
MIITNTDVLDKCSSKDLCASVCVLGSGNECISVSFHLDQGKKQTFLSLDNSTLNDHQSFSLKIQS